MIVSINKEIVNEENAKVSIFDRGFLYGDSVYEAIITYNTKPFLLDQHLDRLWSSASTIALTPQWSRLEITEEIKKGIKLLDKKRQYVRIIITRGEGEIGLDPAQSHGQNLIIIFKELSENPKGWYHDGVHLIVADKMKSPKPITDPSVKSGNYIRNIMALKQARDQGAQDAIMLNNDDQVTECTTSNIWIIKDEVIITPPLSAGLLGGITRAKILELAEENDLKVKEEVFKVASLYSADECFLTASSKELVPITKISDYVIGNGRPGPITKRLHRYYLDFIAKTLR